MSSEKIWVLIFAVMAAGIVIYFKTLEDQKNLAEAIRPIKEKIAAAKRPRVISFTAKWCGACQQFKPVLNRVMADYSQSVDCEIVDVDDSTNDQLVRSFRVNRIPATFIFNRQGDVVYKHTGYMQAKDLDIELRKTIL